MPRDQAFEYRFANPAEAVAALVREVRAVEAEEVPLERCAERVLAQDVMADRASPAVDVSSMDGYAVRVGDVGKGVLKVVGEVRIGLEPPGLPAGVAMRIVTGGAIPAGAEAVIRREDVVERAGEIEVVAAKRGAVKVGENIRRAGENLARGAVVVGKGAVISAPVAGALAAFGVTRVRVAKVVRVAVLTTGDEVVRPEQTPTPWQLRDSNGAALMAMLRGLAFVEARHEHVRDDEGAMREAVARAVATADAVLLTGGVSMGHRDFVGDALATAVVRTVFHGLPQRPGKPILGGVTGDGKPVLGLPGNPVSVLVTARRFGGAALMARAGASAAAPAEVEIANPDGKAIELWWHRLVKVVGAGRAELVDARSSGDVVGAARSDGFVEVPPGQSGGGPWPFFAWA